MAVKQGAQPSRHISRLACRGTCNVELDSRVKERTFSSQGGPVPIDGLCTALVSFASEGCTKATPTPNKDACVAEFEEYNTTGDGNFGEKEAQAAIDAVPAQLVKALETGHAPAGLEHLSGRPALRKLALVE